MSRNQGKRRTSRGSPYTRGCRASGAPPKAAAREPLGAECDRRGYVALFSRDAEDLLRNRLAAAQFSAENVYQGIAENQRGNRESTDRLTRGTARFLADTRGLSPARANHVLRGVELVVARPTANGLHDVIRIFGPRSMMARKMSRLFIQVLLPLGPLPDGSAPRSRRFCEATQASGPTERCSPLGVAGWPLGWVGYRSRTSPRWE